MRRLYPQYTASLYWALNLMATVGYGAAPRTEAEQWFASGCFLLCAALCTSAIAQVVAIVAHWDAPRLRRLAQRDAVNATLRAHRVPAALADDVRHFAASAVTPDLQVSPACTRISTSS